MSNFIGRLVARSAGAAPAPGLPLLAPRPVSRFEPAAIIETHSFAPAAGPAESSLAAPADHAPPMERLAQSLADDHPPARRRTEAVAIDQNRVTETLAPMEGARANAPESADRQEARTPDSNAEPRLREPAVAPLRAETDSSPAARQQAASQQPPHESHRTRVEFIPTTLATDDGSRVGDVMRPIGPATEPPVAKPHAPVESAAPPAITIGKIEVQFLPQESHAPASRTLPERTRGFAAYARARRGEPR